MRCKLIVVRCSVIIACTGRPRFGSVRSRFGDGTVPAVLVFGSDGSSAKKGVSVFQYSLKGKDGSGFGSWKTVPAVPVPLSVSGKTVPTVPVSGCGSVPEPPCLYCYCGDMLIRVFPAFFLTVVL